MASAQGMQEFMTMSAPPCAFDNTGQNLTSHCLSFRSTQIVRSFSATTLYSSLSEEEVVSDRSSVLYVKTSLNTLLSLVVCGCQTISEIKEEVMLSHSSDFPIFGEIKIVDIKFKCRSCFHSLEDSMPMRMIPNKRKNVFQLYVDASSSVELHEEHFLNHWSDTDEDTQGDNGAIGQEESGDLQTCLDSPGAITPCSICLRGLGASSLSPRKTDDKEMSLVVLTNNSLIATEPAEVADAGKIGETQDSVSEHGDKKRKKPTPKKISSRKKDPRGKRHIPKQVGNSVPTFESRTKPNEENFHTGMVHEGT